jgi:geranylgeranyl pyrophosphate synthase
MIARPRQPAFAERVDEYRRRVEQRLAEEIARSDGVPARLREAMEYSVLGSGKRIRPLLAYAAAELCQIGGEPIDAIAASVELIHAYSLIHDDLPAMDDDDLRRGRPTTHRAFSEALAILAGDALQALAFEVLCVDPVLSRHPGAQVKVMTRLARAAGPAGMVGGQVMDLEAEDRQVAEPELEETHRRKTGRLIRAAIMMPSELVELSAYERERLERFADDIGLVFQIKDDLLEIEQDTATLGKRADSDTAKRKSTYPSVLGTEGARARADSLYRKAITCLDGAEQRASGLRWLSELIFTRSY